MAQPYDPLADGFLCAAPQGSNYLAIEANKQAKALMAAQDAKMSAREAYDKGLEAARSIGIHGHHLMQGMPVGERNTFNQVLLTQEQHLMQALATLRMNMSALGLRTHDVMDPGHCHGVSIGAKKRPAGPPVLRKALEAIDYLLADVRGNVARNPALNGLDTNFAMRQAQEAADELRASL